MYYKDRISLGQQIGDQLIELKGQEPVVMALRESYAQMCIGVATKVNGWVFPMLSERIMIPGDPRIMGIISQDGKFTWNPDISRFERSGLEADFFGLIEDQKRIAFSKLNQMIAEYGEFSKHALNGRTILLAGDVIADRLEFASALEYLKEVRSVSIYGIGGNVDALVADEMHLKTDKTAILDVMTHMFDPNHYFDDDDGYSPEECRKLVINISQYWV